MRYNVTDARLTLGGIEIPPIWQTKAAEWPESTQHEWLAQMAELHRSQRRRERRLFLLDGVRLLPWFLATAAVLAITAP